MPWAGKLTTIVPVDTAQVGCTATVATGDSGAPGTSLIITSSDKAEGHPIELITVKLYFPVVNPVIVWLGPEPDIAPGLIIQFPKGKLFKTTLAVEIVQVGWIIAPNIGVSGPVFGDAVAEPA